MTADRRGRESCARGRVGAAHVRRQLELEPVRRRLDIPGVDPDLETPEQKWRKARARLAINPALDAHTLDTKPASSFRKARRDYFQSQYDDDGRCVRRLRQLHVTRRAAAPTVAVIASTAAFPTWRSYAASRRARRRLKAGGATPRRPAPYFTAHTYSLDSMELTARAGHARLFLPPKARRADARARAPAGRGAGAGGRWRRGGTDPAPTPRRRRPRRGRSTPSCRRPEARRRVQHRHRRCRDFDLPGVPEKEGHLSAIEQLDSPTHREGAR